MSCQITFQNGTDEKVQHVLLQNMHGPQRLRIFYGDPETGREWLEEFDVHGRIGHSTGPVRVPLLIRTTRSHGGGAILTDKILKIQAGKQVLYEHPKHKPPVFDIAAPPDRIGKTDMKAEGYTHGVYVVGEDGKRVNHANFKSERAARSWVAYMLGQRMSK